jgi:hypothetical protein
VRAKSSHRRRGRICLHAPPRELVETGVDHTGLSRSTKAATTSAYSATTTRAGTSVGWISAHRRWRSAALQYCFDPLERASP